MIKNSKNYTENPKKMSKNSSFFHMKKHRSFSIKLVFFIRYVSSDILKCAHSMSCEKLHRMSIFSKILHKRTNGKQLNLL